MLFDWEPGLPTSIQWDVMIVINLDDLSVWVQACQQWVVLFRRVMPMAMENLAITQHRDISQHATIRGGGYRPWVRRFELRDYVYM